MVECIRTVHLHSAAVLPEEVLWSNRHTTHNAASCIQMLDMLLAFRCGCKGERLHLNADAIRC